MCILSRQRLIVDETYFPTMLALECWTGTILRHNSLQTTVAGDQPLSRFRATRLLTAKQRIKTREFIY